MPSQSLTNLTERLKDIDQLLKAHTAIMKFNNAESAAKQAGGQLAQVAKVLHALVTSPGPGKPKEVDAINRAAYVLLTAHFQGFVDELHLELGKIVLKGKVSDPEAIVKLVKPPRSNPHVQVINQMFAGLGVYELMDGISWQKCNNKTVKSRLTAYLETRNKIAHGSKVPITKDKVEKLKEYVELLAKKLDSECAKKAKAAHGATPW